MQLDITTCHVECRCNDSVCFPESGVAQDSGQDEGFTCVAQNTPGVQEHLLKSRSVAPAFVSGLGDLPVQTPCEEDMFVKSCLWHHKLPVHAACTVCQQTFEGLFVLLQKPGILIYSNVCQVNDNPQWIVTD